MMDKRRKDPADKKSVPTRANSKMDSEEQEFWNLGESGEGGRGDDPEAPARTCAEPEEAIDLGDDVFDDIDDAGLNEDEDAPEHTGGSPGPGKDGPPAAPAAPSTGGRASGKGENIALAILGTVLLAGIIWGATVFIGTLPDGEEKKRVEFPLRGNAVTIASADTYWRKPDRSRDRGVRMDTRLIPAAVITLGDNPGSCALRFFFSDDKGDLVGDSTTHGAASGRFSANGTAEVEVHGTAGFADPGDHAAYTTDQIGTWHLVIMEGPDADARGAEFREIARIPISYDRR